MADSEFYQNLSDSLKRQIISECHFVGLEKQFDTLFCDSEFRFKADFKMVSMFLSSLKIEPENKVDWISLNTTSKNIFLIAEGSIEVKYAEHPILTFRDGSYFGEVSFLLNVANKYNFIGNKNTKLYSIGEKHLLAIFELYPDFKSMLLIRALRRYRYMKKLVAQQQAFLQL